VVGDERVMYEQPQWRARDADRPDVGLQTLPVDGPRTGLGELPAFFCFEPLPGSDRRDELILKTVESHWPCGQREP
jgi:hypothetical protein